MDISRISAILPLGLLLMLTPAGALAQELMVIDGYCSFTGDELPDEVYGFESDSEARAAVERIVNYTGLQQNFDIRAANVQNAMAVIRGETRQILYNEQFMMRVRQVTNTDWAAISIMAHEVGHHLQGHTITSGGSRPTIELQADRYSGYVLYRMGASLEQAQAAMQALASETGSATHPGKSARLAAITNGWNAARLLDEADDSNNGTTTGTVAENASNPTPPQISNPLPTGSSIPTSTPAMAFVVRVVFTGDPSTYYVTASDDIVGIPPGGTPTIVGRKLPPTMPGFAWMYATSGITYGVTPDGRVMSRTPYGVPFQVGHLANP